MEKELLQSILLRVGKHFRHVRIFRNNVGMGWIGVVIKKTVNTILLGEPRPLHAGLIQGSCDLIGWTTVTITPEMVGQKVAIFTGIETKVNGKKPDKAQKIFIENLKQAGGIAFVAWDETDIDAPFTTHQ